MTRVIDYRKALRGISQFSQFTDRSLERLLGCCHMRAVKKGEAVICAGGLLDDLIVIIRGRLTSPVRNAFHDRVEYGSGEAVETAAFFSRSKAATALTALRDSQLLCLGYDDLVAVCMNDAMLVACLLKQIASGASPGISKGAPPTRIAVCPAGLGATLDLGLIDGLSAAFEHFGEVRTLTAQSFGAGLPGGITLSDPETDHGLQEQDLAFDLTLTIAGPAHIGFAMTAVEEADEVIMIAAGTRNGADLNPIETHAFESRGPQRCHLLCLAGETGRQDFNKSLEKRRAFRTGGFASPQDQEGLARFVAGIMNANER